MVQNMPSEWFKSAKSHQFEGRHHEAIQHFEKCLQVDWRVELVVKEMYNSLIKLKNYPRALEVLTHYGQQIQQRDWLRRELLNLNKKLEKTDAVRLAYFKLLNEQLKRFSASETSQLANEFALYYYRLGLNEAFSAMCEQAESDEDSRLFVPILRGKWLLHFAKDLKHVLRLSARRGEAQGDRGHFHSRSYLWTTVSEQAEQGYLKAMLDDEVITHTYALADNLSYKMTLLGAVDQAIGRQLHELALQDAHLVFDRLLQLECPEWTMPYVVALGKALLRDESVKGALQALAAQLVQHQQMLLLDTLVSGIPELYIVDEERDAYTNTVFSTGEPIAPQDGPIASALALPEWSQSEVDYIEGFLNRLSKSVKAGLKYAKLQVIADIRKYQMSDEETLETLWRLRIHYKSAEVNQMFVWLKLVLDMILKDIHNVGLWLELPYIVQSMLAQRALDKPLENRLALVANHAYLFALYAMEKRGLSYPEAFKQQIEDNFEPLALSEHWHRYVRFVEACQFNGVRLPIIDQLYGYFQAAQAFPGLQESWQERVSSLNFELSIDLNALLGPAESHRYVSYALASLQRAYQGMPLQGEMATFASIIDGRFAQVAAAAAGKMSYAYPLEALNAKLTVLSVLCYDGGVEQCKALCDGIEELLTQTGDSGLEQVYHLLRDCQSRQLGTMGIRLVNHALNQMGKALSVEDAFVNEVKVDYLERVALEEGIAVFNLLCQLDPTSIPLSFHRIDLHICLQQYSEAYRLIGHWLELYEGQKHINPEDRAMRDTVIYQGHWLKATLPGTEPVEATDAVAKAIISVKVAASEGELLYLRNVLIHRDIELLSALFQQQGDLPLLRTAPVLQLIHAVFGSEFRVLMLVLWQHHALTAVTSAYSQMLHEQNPEVGSHFEALRRLYRKDYGRLDAWMSFSGGRVTLNQESWLSALEGAIQNGLRERFVWLIHLWVFLVDPESVAHLVAKALDGFRFTKWSQEGYWVLAFEILPYGDIAFEMGKEALRQGRYETARQCFRSFPLERMMPQVVQRLKQMQGQHASNAADNASWHRWLDSALAYILAGDGLIAFDEVVWAHMDSSQVAAFYREIFTRADAREYAKALHESLRRVVMHSGCQRVIALWYAYEQHQLGNNQLAQQLEAFVIQG